MTDDAHDETRNGELNMSFSVFIHYRVYSKGTDSSSRTGTPCVLCDWQGGSDIQ